ncbi:MAG: tetratricopeptide repeat protein [Oculatellaceae cyanobacterium bins.114]|nr:tetratricopeptide repeat protein [Oculatellaceae cyanobacterium bins.114]
MAVNLSFCMIVKNEAKNLPRCLNSVRTVANEWVVLDTGSTDETVAIAQSFGAQVHHFTWNHDFSAARNEALKYVSGDWVLVLDADEVLTADSVPLIQLAVQQKDCLVINLLRQEVGAVQSPYSLVSRLFRRHPDICFSRPYHAMIDDSVTQLLVREPHWQIVDLSEVAILHYGYEPGAIASRDKFHQARTTMERFLALNPGDPYACNKLGALYVEMGKVDYGIELLERGLASQRQSTPLDAAVLFELHYHLGIAYNRLKDTQRAEQHYNAATQQPILEPLKLGAYNNLGSLQQAQGNFEGAKAAYEAALEADPEFAIGHYNLGMTLKAMGQLEDAIAHYKKALQLNPIYAEALQNLGVVLLKLGRVEESMAAFQRAILLHEQRNVQEAERLRSGLRQMGFEL